MKCVKKMEFVPVMDSLHDHLDVPSIVDAFACSTVSICVSGSTPKVILNNNNVHLGSIRLKGVMKSR